MTSSLSVFQLNIRGFNQAKRKELQNILVRHAPDIFLLQETFLKQENIVHDFKGYNIARWDRVHKTGGGLLSLVKNDLAFRIHDPSPQGEMEVGIIDIKLLGSNKWISIANCYAPKTNKFSLNQFKLIVNACGPVKIISGDFNLHHRMWDTVSPEDPIATPLTDYILEPINKLSLVTPKDLNTRLNPQTGKYSTIDLTFTSSDIINSVEIQKPCDFDSDHEVLSLTLEINPVRSRFQPVKFWKFQDKLWNSWKHNLDQKASEIKTSDQSVESLSNKITSAIIASSERIFGYKQPHPKRQNSTPGWNNKCQKAYLEKKKAKNNFSRYPSIENKIFLEQKTAEFKKTLKTETQDGWRRLIEDKFGHNTPVRELWRNFQVFSGKKRRTPIPAEIQMGRTTEFSTNGKLNLFLEKFLKVDTPSQLTHHQLSLKNGTVPFSHFSFQEVKDTISKLQPGATGPDGIHNLMLKNLPDTFVELLTELFNRSVIESSIPSEWNKATVIPLLKAGKDPRLVDSYRPISLTSCVAKLIERVIKQRILTPLSDHIQIEQLGFLPGRSTTDALVRLEHLIKQSFKKGKAVHVIFLDMESAFDRVDVRQLIRKLSVMGLPDLLVNWIHQFLMGREVQTSLGGSFSEFKRKAFDIGLPQGAVLSPLLFSVYCHDISLENVLGAELFLYADDIAVAVVGRDPVCLQSASQKAVDMLSIWAKSNNMVFSSHKSVSVFFHKMHNLDAFKPLVKLNGHGIVVAEHARFLGIVFDQKLTWKPHLDELIGSLKQRQNFINALCLGRRGAPTVFASTIVKSVVISKIDYGSFIYGSAKKCLLKKLDTTLHAILRRALGCLKSTPIAAMYCEVGIQSLHSRRKYLLARYFAKKIRLKNHIIYKGIISHHNPDVRYKPTEMPSFQRFLCLPGMEEFIENGRLTVNLDDDSPSASKGIGELIIPKISIEKKEDLPQAVMKIIFLGKLAEYQDYIQVYTDGSKTETKCSCAVVIPSQGLSLSYRLPPYLTIFSAELMALKFSLQAIASQTETKNRKYIVCTDSLSALDYLSHQQHQARNVAMEIENLTTQLARKGISVLFIWVPAHCGIKGNELADQAAKQASHLGLITQTPITGPEFLSSISSKILEEEEAWLHSFHTQLLDLYNYKQPSKEMYLSSRILSTCLFRLRCGHARTKSTLFHWKMTPSPNCDTCGVYEDIRHIIFNCRKYEKEREILRNCCERAFKAFTMRSVLGHYTSPPWARQLSTNLLGRFVKTTGLVHSL